MKILCEHCHKEMTKEVINQFGHYKIGHTLCPHCHKKSRRYLSELDILLFYSICAILYAIALLITMTLMRLNGTTLTVIIITLFNVSSLYFLMKWISLNIYKNAWLKKEWKNLCFVEDANKIAKRGKRQYWIIMLIAFLFATQIQLINFYPALILVLCLIQFIQIILLYGKEKEYIESIKSK